MTTEKTILLVEDNLDDVKLTERALKKSGLPLKLVVAATGPEAFDYLFATGSWEGRSSESDPVVVLLDLNLPGLDGREVLRRLRADARTKNVPVVVLTSSDDERDIVRSYNLGCNSFVRKPVIFNEFMEEVGKLGEYWLDTNKPPLPIEGQPLRLLVVEDSEDDALLLVRELRKGGMNFIYDRVENLDGVKTAIDSGTIGAIISDFKLPGFDGLDVLRLVRARGLDVPFLLVSGVVGEERAVEAMKAGAHDFIPKGNYTRLIPALERELREAVLRRQRREAEAELEKYRERLEELVRGRTAELEQANRKLAESNEALRESEELLRATFEQAPIGLEILDLQGRFLKGNIWFAHMLGYDDDELRNLTFAAVTAADDLTVELPLLKRLLAGEIPSYTLEKRYIRKDGRSFWGRVTSSVSWAGEPHRISVIENIHERKEAEERLRASEQRLRLATESAKMGTWVWEPGSDLHEWDKQTRRIFGGSEEGPLSYDLFLSLLHPEDRDRVHETVWTSFNKGEPCETEYRIFWPDGSLHWIMAIGHTLVEQSGRPKRMIGIVMDVTDRKLYEEALSSAKEAAEAAVRAKTDFMANMSHEIRTPLNGILGVTDLILEMELPDLQRQYLEMVKGSGEALLAVVNDVLDFSKIEAGGMVLDNMEFSLLEIVEKAAGTFSVRAFQKGLELAVVIEPNLPELFIGDPLRLRQVLLNLVGNAVKFTDTGEVAVRVAGTPTEEDKWRLTLSVSDTGIGIPQDKFGLLFQSFTQLDASVTRSYGGTGLGLAICKRIVELMGGRVWVESNEGRGSTFSFEIELAKAAHPVALEVPHFAELAGLRTLVVDDNDTNRTMLQRSLTAKGLSVEVAKLGKEGVEKAFAAADAGRPFDLVLIDLHLPDMDGFQIAERLRERFPISRLALMMITSDDIAGGTRRARDLGMTAYIVKPVRVAELMEALARLRDDVATIPSEPTPEAAPRYTAIPYCTHILVVEDNPVNLTVTEAILRKAGVRVTAATNGIEAVDCFEHGRFNLILMDVQMPEMDGFEATRVLRAKGADVPVIGLTAHALEGDRERCLAAGMDDYLPKPVTSHVLHEKIAYWVRQRPVSAADPATMLSEVGGGLGELDIVVNTFLQSAPEQLADVRRAVAAKDESKLQNTAHRLKGALAVVAAEVARCLAEELETMAKVGDFSRIDEVLAQLEAEMTRVEAQLRQQR